MTPDQLAELEQELAAYMAWKGSARSTEAFLAKLLPAAPALIAAARERDEIKGKYAAAQWDRECLMKRRDELEAQLARIHDLQDRWWNHGDELDALYAERLSTALTPPETAAGKDSG